MTALIQGRARSFERWTHHLFPLAAGQHVYKGGRAAIDLQTGKVVKVTSNPGLLVIGSFDREINNNTGNDLQVNVNLGMEIEVERLEIDANSITAADLGSICYAVDDQTVSGDGAGRSIAGRVWWVEGNQALVQKLDGALIGAAGGGGGADVLTLPSFTANNIAVGDVDERLNGSTFDIPATSAASTVTLPAAAPDGTMVSFSADGTKNAHTVQYRDETGPTNLTTALAAAKRHLVLAVKVSGTWRANAYVSP